MKSSARLLGEMALSPPSQRGRNATCTDTPSPGEGNPASANAANPHTHTPVRQEGTLAIASATHPYPHTPVRQEGTPATANFPLAQQQLQQQQPTFARGRRSPGRPIAHSPVFLSISCTAAWHARRDTAQTCSSVSHGTTTALDGCFPCEQHRRAPSGLHSRERLYSDTTHRDRYTANGMVNRMKYTHACPPYTLNTVIHNTHSTPYIHFTPSSPHVPPGTLLVLVSCWPHATNSSVSLYKTYIREEPFIFFNSANIRCRRLYMQPSHCLQEATARHGPPLHAWTTSLQAASTLSCTSEATSYTSYIVLHALLSSDILCSAGSISCHTPRLAAPHLKPSSCSIILYTGVGTSYTTPHALTSTESPYKRVRFPHTRHTALHASPRP